MRAGKYILLVYFMLILAACTGTEGLETRGRLITHLGRIHGIRIF